MSFKEFIFCYRKSLYSQHWECERGYTSVDEVDTRVHELRSADLNVSTTFFPTYSFIPTFVQKRSIQWQLRPRITMSDVTHKIED